MNLKNTLRRLPALFIARLNAAHAKKRRTLALPAALTYTARAEALPKPTPANLRKFAETPVARKAINTIKDRVAGMKWRVEGNNSHAAERNATAGPIAPEPSPTISASHRTDTSP